MVRRTSRGGGIPAVVPAWIAASGAGIIGLLLLAANHTPGWPIYPSLLVYLIPPVLALAAAWAASRRWPGLRRRPGLRRGDGALLVLFLFALLHLCSSAVRDRWFYFLLWRPVTDDFLASGIVRFSLLTLLLTPVLIAGVRRPALTFTILLIAAQAVCFYSYLDTFGGGVLYRNDHPSFLYRIHEFARNFPQAVNYLPYWNAGYAHYYSTTSGTPSFGIFFLPLWRYFPVHQVYTWIAGFSFIVVGPLLALAAVRISGAGRAAAAIGGLLFLCHGPDLFRWAFEFGTLPGVFSTCFGLVLAAGLFRAAWFPRPGPGLAAAIILGGSFFLLWPPAGLIAAAMVLPWLLRPTLWTRRKWIFLVLCSLGIAILCGRWFLVWFLKARDVTGYFQGAVGQTAGSVPLISRGAASGWLRHLGTLRRIHPLVIYLGLGAAFVSPFASVRRWYPPVFLSLAALLWLGVWNPRLQLDRMFPPVAIIAVIPAAITTWRLLGTRAPLLAPVRAALAALLLLGIVNQARVYSNRSLARTRVLDRHQQELVDFLREAEGGGRVLLAGAAHNAYGDGQAAYLPILTGKEMLALDYYYFPEEWTGTPFPPPPFDRDADQLFRYMELYNVLWVVAYDPEWVERFRADEAHYRPAHSVHFPYGRTGYDACIFRVRREPSFLLAGRGTVESGSNFIRVSLAEPRATVVLKYNWADGLRPEGPVGIFPFDAGDGIRFIGVETRGETEFVLRYRSRL